jgi:outer membrane protein TolC
MPSSRRRTIRTIGISTLACLALLHNAAALPGGEPTAASAAPSGPSVRRLTVEEARQLALERNQALALARLNVAEKGHATAAARKDYFPKLIALDTYFRFNDDLGSVVTVQRGRLGVLPPGATTIEANVLNQDSNLASLMVAQPITKLIAVNAATQIARAEEGAAQAQLDKGTRDVLSGVTQAYEGLFGARRIEAALELQLRMLEQLHAAKPTPETQIFVLGTRQALLDVRGQVRELTQTLNDLLDLPACTELELVDPIPAELPVRCEDEAARLAREHSPEVHEAEQSIAKAEAAMKVAKMAYLPDVNVVGGYANQTAASYIQPNIGYVGVSGSWALFEWGKKRDIKRQRDMDIALAHQSVRVASDKVQLQARKAYSSYDQAREALRIAGEMVQARKDAVRTALPALVTQANADAARAELEYMKAEITYRVAHAQLSALIGGN